MGSGGRMLVLVVGAGQCKRRGAAPSAKPCVWPSGRRLRASVGATRAGCGSVSWRESDCKLETSTRLHSPGVDCWLPFPSTAPTATPTRLVNSASHPRPWHQVPLARVCDGTHPHTRSTHLHAGDSALRPARGGRAPADGGEQGELHSDVSSVWQCGGVARGRAGGSLGGGSTSPLGRFRRGWGGRATPPPPYPDDPPHSNTHTPLTHHRQPRRSPTTPYQRAAAACPPRAAPPQLRATDRAPRAAPPQLRATDRAPRAAPAGGGDDDDDAGSPSASALLSGGTLAAVAGLVVLGGAALAAREPLRAFVDYFIGVVDDLGPAG